MENLRERLRYASMQTCKNWVGIYSGRNKFIFSTKKIRYK